MDNDMDDLLTSDMFGFHQALLDVMSFELFGDMHVPVVNAALAQLKEELSALKVPQFAARNQGRRPPRDRQH